MAANLASMRRLMAKTAIRLLLCALVAMAIPGPKPAAASTRCVVPRPKLHTNYNETRLRIEVRLRLPTCWGSELYRTNWRGVEERVLTVTTVQANDACRRPGPCHSILIVKHPALEVANYEYSVGFPDDPQERKRLRFSATCVSSAAAAQCLD